MVHAASSGISKPKQMTHSSRRRKRAAHSSPRMIAWGDTLVSLSIVNMSSRAKRDVPTVVTAAEMNGPMTSVMMPAMIAAADGDCKSSDQGESETQNQPCAQREPFAAASQMREYRIGLRSLLHGDTH